MASTPTISQLEAGIRDGVGDCVEGTYERAPASASGSKTSYLLLFTHSRVWYCSSIRSGKNDKKCMWWVCVIGHQFTEIVTMPQWGEAIHSFNRQFILIILDPTPTKKSHLVFFFRPSRSHRRESFSICIQNDCHSSISSVKYIDSKPLFNLIY